MTKKLLIAIDGPSASGKGSLAEKLADHFGLSYLNTGALYRICANRYRQFDLTEENFEENIARLVDKIDQENFENEVLFTEEVGQIASVIARNAKLRAALFEFQKKFIEDSIRGSNGAAIDGRDVASVIMPQANYKFFVTASVEERAKRRFLQLQDKGDDVTLEEILTQLKSRDDSDKNRANSPLTLDPDAILIDNSSMTKAQTLAKVLECISEVSV